MLRITFLIHKNCVNKRYFHLLKKQLIITGILVLTIMLPLISKEWSNSLHEVNFVETKCPTLVTEIFQQIEDLLGIEF